MEQYIYKSNDAFIISKEEQKIIVRWVRKNRHKFTLTEYHSSFGQLKNFDDIPKCVYDIKKRIIKKEKLHNAITEPYYTDAIGYIWQSGQLYKHIDPNKSGLIHTRYNVFVQMPTEGGFPIYNNKVLHVKERTYTCCRSGLDYHSCEKVVSSKERIILSYGFLLPIERVQNIIYDY